MVRKRRMEWKVNRVLQKIKINDLELGDIPCLIEYLYRSDYKVNSLDNQNKQNIIDSIFLFWDNSALFGMEEFIVDYFQPNIIDTIKGAFRKKCGFRFMKIVWKNPYK